MRQKLMRHPYSYWTHIQVGLSFESDEAEPHIYNLNH